jgi:hypothetical protein
VNICVQLGIIIFILFAGLNAGYEDPLYKSLETNLAKYRQSLTSDDVTMQNGIFRLEMNGRRTNIKSQLLIGFYSIGRVLQKSSTPFREVQVVIYYDLKEREEVLAKAPEEKVIDLSQGRISLEQFFVLIGY